MNSSERRQLERKKIYLCDNKYSLICVGYLSFRCEKKSREKNTKQPTKSICRAQAHRELVKISESVKKIVFQLQFLLNLGFFFSFFLFLFRLVFGRSPIFFFGLSIALHFFRRLFFAFFSLRFMCTIETNKKTLNFLFFFVKKIMQFFLTPFSMSFVFFAAHFSVVLERNCCFFSLS